MKQITLLFLCAVTTSLFALGKRELNKQLLVAAATDDVQKVRMLIVKGAQLHVRNEHGQTPLHLARNPEVVHELIIAGADVNKTDWNGLTALHKALHENDKHKAMLLLYSGAKANTQAYGATPLQLAIERNDYQLVYELIKGGAKVTPKSVDYAKVYRHTEIAQLLANYRTFKGKKSPLKTLDEMGQMPIHKAVMENNRVLVDALSLSGASVNSKNKDGQTPMHIAVKHNLDNMTRKLVQLHANANIADSNGQTPFHYAAQRGRVSISNMLREHGAAHYLVDKYGQTPFRYFRDNRQLALVMHNRAIA